MNPSLYCVCDLRRPATEPVLCGMCDRSCTECGSLRRVARAVCLQACERCPTFARDGRHAWLPVDADKITGRLKRFAHLGTLYFAIRTRLGETALPPDAAVHV